MDEDFYGEEDGAETKEVALTGADLADLAAGHSFNTAVSDGSEVVIFGDDLSDEEVKELASGASVSYDAYGIDYTLTAPEPAWAGHRGPEDVKLTALRPGSLRWALARGLDKKAA